MWDFFRIRGNKRNEERRGTTNHARTKSRMLMHRMLLMRLGLLESLSEEQISRVQERLRRRCLAAGQALFVQGERCEHLHIVQDGVIRLRCEDESKGDRTLEIVPEGHVLGEAGVFMSIPYPCSAEAVQDSVVASLHQDELRRLIDSVPGFGWQMLRLLSKRLVGTQLHVQALASPNVRGRVGAVLLHLAQEAEDPLKAGPVTLRARQEELAQMAGVTRETVSRALGEWSRAGLLVVGRGRLTIPDTSRLRSVMEKIAEPATAVCPEAGAQLPRR
jgi:CRP/FNR family transcriptional regulator